MAAFERRSLESGERLPEFLPPEPRRRPRTRLLSCFFIVVVLIAGVITTVLARANNNFFVGVKHGFLVRQLSHLFNGSANLLKGESDDRINFLLVGIGGPGHEGPYLTDTIILASYKPSTKEAAMISIPRDLIVPTENGQYQKVNHVYALSLNRGLETAFERTKTVIGKAFDVPIHYLAVVDFQGFVELIDSIGGVTVDVERSFTDNQFPGGSDQTVAVSFKEGKQKMDGTTALRYARSRHGNNGEGSDFARSKRQQKIILATKEKLASFNTLINPSKITSLFRLVNDYTKTDIEPWEVVKLVHLTRSVDPGNITTIVLDDQPGGYVRGGISSIDGSYILQPVDGTYAGLQAIAETIFDHSAVRKEKAVVVVQNGTAIPNIALTAGNALERSGMSLAWVGNAPAQNHLTTVIYDYTKGAKPASRAFLENRFSVSSQTTVPLDLLEYNLVRAYDIKDAAGNVRDLDFLVIVGEDIRKEAAPELIRTLTPQELAATSTDEVPAEAPGEE